MDIKKLLIDYNINYWDKGKNVTPGWVNIRCPFCDDKSNHGGFNPLKEYYNCWHCRWHPLEKVLSAILGVSEYEAKNILKNYQTQPLKSIEEIRRPSRLEIPGSELKHPHIRYLLKRGFEPRQLVEKYHILGTLHENAKYSYRIIIPIFYKGRAISFQSRMIVDNVEQKYKACSKRLEIIEHKKMLYNIDNCVRDRVIVVEGVLDCWKIGDDCCCTFGVDYTKEQLLMLSKFKKIFVCYDPDEAGEPAAIKLSNELSILNKEVEIIELENDPGSLSIKEGKYLRKHLIGA